MMATIPCVWAPPDPVPPLLDLLLLELLLELPPELLPSPPAPVPVKVGLKMLPLSPNVLVVSPNVGTTRAYFSV
jgi:hypothetical protein